MKAEVRLWSRPWRQLCRKRRLSARPPPLGAHNGACAAATAAPHRARARARHFPAQTSLATMYPIPVKITNKDLQEGSVPADEGAARHPHAACDPSPHAPSSDTAASTLPAPYKRARQRKRRRHMAAALITPREARCSPPDLDASVPARPRRPGRPSHIT